MGRPDAVIFDLDGTLLHSAPDLHAATNRALEDIGCASLGLAEVTRFIGNGVEALVARALDARGGGDKALEASMLASFLAAYAADPVTLTKPYPGVMDCLERCRAQGVRMGLCTNKPQEAAREICTAMGLSPFFEVVAGALPHIAKKPDPAPLLVVIDALGADPAGALYIGDSAVDYETARAAGVSFRLFEGGYLNAPLPKLEARHRFAHWSDLVLTL